MKTQSGPLKNEFANFLRGAMGVKEEETTNINKT